MRRVLTRYRELSEDRAAPFSSRQSCDDRRVTQLCEDRIHDDAAASRQHPCRTAGSNRSPRALASVVFGPAIGARHSRVLERPQRMRYRFAPARDHLDGSAAGSRPKAGCRRTARGAMHARRGAMGCRRSREAPSRRALRWRSVSSAHSRPPRLPSEQRSRSERARRACTSFFKRAATGARSSHSAAPNWKRLFRAHWPRPVKLLQHAASSSKCGREVLRVVLELCPNRGPR